MLVAPLHVDCSGRFFSLSLVYFPSHHRRNQGNECHAELLLSRIVGVVACAKVFVYGNNAWHELGKMHIFVRRQPLLQHLKACGEVRACRMGANADNGYWPILFANKLDKLNVRAHILLNRGRNDGGIVVCAKVYQHQLGAIGLEIVRGGGVMVEEL